MSHEACANYPSRDWCRACGGAGQSDAHTRQREEQNGLFVASMDFGSSLMDRNQYRKVAASSPREPLRFLVVKVKPSMMIWSMLVQCKGVEDDAGIKVTVESLNRLGWS